MILSSLQNPKVKDYCKLMKSKKERDQRGLFIVEGEHLVEEALKYGQVLEILVEENTNFNLPIQPMMVTKAVMEKICDTETPQGIIALCQQKQGELNNVNRVLLLDDLNDPGNLGTIIRTADAFGFDAIIMSPNTVDLYNPKVVRATQGAIFRVNPLRQSLPEAILQLQNQGVKIYAADLKGTPLSMLPQEDKIAFVMGNEAQGISQAVKEVVDGSVTIEMAGETESLNVAIAAAIIMYNFRKR